MLLSPALTICPYDCTRPPSGAGASGSSFCPEKTQIEFAWLGPCVIAVARYRTGNGRSRARAQKGDCTQP